MTNNSSCILDHFGIRVNNLEISVSFYEKYFGFQKIRETDKPDLQLKLATLRLGDSYLELLQPYRAKSENSQTRKESLSEIFERTPSHVAIGVDNLPEIHAKLTKNNIALAAFFDITTSKNIFCYDPNGFLIEIRQK